MHDRPRIDPLTAGALTVDFGNEISVELNDRAVALATAFEQHRFPGFIEAVPAFSSVAIFYELSEVRRHFPEFGSSFDAVRNLVRLTLPTLTKSPNPDTRAIGIPVDFTEEVAPDLSAIAAERGITRSGFIEIFLSRTYRVFMLGFLPGFAYMGEVDERIEAPRKTTPRTHVPKGSVGIAGRQTGIYPFESPGGWQIIGRTEIEMFTPDGCPLTLLQPGDEVTFVHADG